MPRRARITLVGVPHHIIHRGNNRSACFHCEQDYRVYLKWLAEYADECECQIHAYVLMTNHVHLLVTPLRHQALADLMKRLSQRYAQYINRRYERSGTLWEGRFKSCVTDQVRYMLNCQRYIELNPVRAHMVDHPSDYPWSSYRANAEGKYSRIITPHALYSALGQTADERQAAYRELFSANLSSEVVSQIRQATNGNYALGSKSFCKEVEALTGKRATRRAAGRPTKK